MLRQANLNQHSDVSIGRR